MNRFYHFLLFCLLLHVTPALAQSVESLRSDPSYLFGEGFGKTAEEADAAALADLVSKITVVVESSFEMTEDEILADGNLDAKSYARSKVKSYSNASLTGTKKIIVTSQPEAHVVRYILKSEVDKLFEARRTKINDFVMAAERNEKEGRIDNALRYYYWAFALLKSLPQPTKEKYYDETGRACLLVSYLPERMNAIFSDLRVGVAGTEGQEVDLNITYRGKAVSSVDYTYFNGRDWSPIYSARDGRGTLELAPGASADNLQLRFEYEYLGEARLDNDVQNVVNVVKGNALTKSYTTVRAADRVELPSTNFNAADFGNELAETNSMADTPAADAAKNATDADTTAGVADTAGNESLASLNRIVSAADAGACQEALSRVLKAIRSRAYASVQDCFTAEGYEAFNKLVGYGRGRILNSQPCSFSYANGEIVGRSVPMSFTFRHGARKQFVENVNFTFNPQNHLITNITFGLGERTMADLTKLEQTPEARAAVTNFLENYQTAYALKNIEYLESIFSDDAVIVTGRVVRKMERITGIDGKSSLKENRYVQYTQQSKNEFISKLGASFKSKEYINLRFTDTMLECGKDEGIYGIQLRQDYYSSNYGDSGYLFLMVDVKNPAKPVIHVRTWQPEPDPTFGIISLGHF